MRKTLAVLTIVLAVATVSHACAQTGQLPQGNSKWSTPPAVAKAPDKSLKPCLRYGEGFYYVPGSDTCVKIGGDVRTDVSTSGRR